MPDWEYNIYSRTVPQCTCGERAGSHLCPRDVDALNKKLEDEKKKLAESNKKGVELCQYVGELLMIISDMDIYHHLVRGGKERLQGHEECVMCSRIEHAFKMHDEPQKR